MIVIIDYKIGNLGSMLNMLKRIGVEAVISSDADTIGEADKLILPGVGAFDHGINNLRESNFFSVLEESVLVKQTPLLGVCLGMQLLGNKSEEGKSSGLGWIDFECVRFRIDDMQKRLRIPHMGWNAVCAKHKHPLLENMGEDTRFYFVHSYHAVCSQSENVLMETDYGYSFTSAVVKGNIYGVQFHPEKSHKFGMELLKNFVECC